MAIFNSFLYVYQRVYVAFISHQHLRRIYFTSSILKLPTFSGFDWQKMVDAATQTMVGLIKNCDHWTITWLGNQRSKWRFSWENHLSLQLQTPTLRLY